MENKLEQLLNSLIKRGRVPFGYELLYPNIIEDCFDYDSRRKKCRFLIHKNFVDEVYNSLRELVSRESGLRQFVCENGMIKKDQHTNTTRIQEYEDERDSEIYSTKYKYDEGSYQHRIIQSSLCDEDKLEDFILSNIKL